MSAAELFVEIRCEELPPSMVLPAVEGLRDGLLKLIAGVEHGEIRTFATPRRIAVAIDAVSSARPKVERVVTGPPADRAFADGKPTPAAAGFAKGKGKDVGDIRIVDTPKGKVIAVTIEEGGESTAELVKTGLEGVIRGLPFHKSMEWGNGGIRFGRPIQGIAGLFGGEALGGSIAGYDVGNASVGHRFAEDTAFTFASADEWADLLRERWVEPDLTARRAAIRAYLDEVSNDLAADEIHDEALLDQVVHLVECPTPVVGTFEEELLQLPPRLLEESMKVHQRYFPIHRNGALTNRFVAISNNPEADPDVVAAGCARVLRARFHDAKFFFAEDKKKPFESFGSGLSRMRWIKGLGTMAQKQERVARLAVALAPIAGADVEVTGRAGRLCKADLLTAMVNEFPELQGHMGRLYAAAGGEADAVAMAIEEHYYPRFAEDRLAETPAGVALALADRLDTLVGCFGVGMIPKGGDPQGLRRAALGVVNTLIGRELNADVGELVRTAISVFHGAVRGESPQDYQAWCKERGTDAQIRDEGALVTALVEFILARFKAQAVSEGVSSDLADAALAGSETRPLVLARKVAALRAMAGSADFLPIMQTFKRILNISAKAQGNPDDRAFTEEAEKGLDEAFTRLGAQADDAVARGDFPAALEAMMQLKDPVARFFDDVLVEDPDAAVKARRIGLLQRISTCFLQVADFSRITTR